jgi:hypothetical protein
LSLSIRLYGVLKSMTKQFVVKQSIRIGDYVQSPIYVKIFNYSFWIMIILFFITFIVSALYAQGLEFWHVWEWFQ